MLRELGGRLIILQNAKKYSTRALPQTFAHPGSALSFNLMIQVIDGLLESAEQNKKNLEARPDRWSLRGEDDRAGSPLHLLRELGMEGEICSGNGAC